MLTRWPLSLFTMETGLGDSADTSNCGCPARLISRDAPHSTFRARIQSCGYHEITYQTLFVPTSGTIRCCSNNASFIFVYSSRRYQATQVGNVGVLLSLTRIYAQTPGLHCYSSFTNEFIRTTMDYRCMKPDLGLSSSSCIKTARHQDHLLS